MNNKLIDPFAIKRRSKMHPVRLLYTAAARYEEWNSRRRFLTYKIPLKPLESNVTFNVDYNRFDTAVTPEQMKTLLAAVRETSELPDPIVEIGSFRGVSTQAIAGSTAKCVFAVDPFTGYGGAESDYLLFHERTRDLSNVAHLRETSGSAATNSALSSVSFAFIDAVHDYVNAKFDGMTWSRKLVKGGLIAFHDTDTEDFPGVTRAVYELLEESNGSLSLHLHVPGLVVLKRS